MTGAESIDLSTPVAALGLVALLVGAAMVLFSTRSKQAKSDLQASVTALQGEDTANKSALERIREQNTTQAEQLRSANRQIDDLRLSIRTLERVVTGVDVIIEGFTLLAGPERATTVRAQLELVRSTAETSHHQPAQWREGGGDAAQQRGR